MKQVGEVLGLSRILTEHLFTPRLGRDVAIRVCVRQFTDRFEREARAIAIATQIADALEAAHEKGSCLAISRLPNPPIHAGAVPARM